VAGWLALATLMVSWLAGAASPATTPPPAPAAPAPPPPPAAAPRPIVPAPPPTPPPAVPPFGERGETAPAAPPPAAPGTDERHVPTLDTAAAESDHDAVRDAWGVQVRPVATKLSVFALRSDTGCPVATATAATGGCPPVTASALAVRRWIGRNLAWNGGVAVALGGGSDGGRLLDTYFGAGPLVGASILLANWRHLAVSANPELLLVFFKGSGSAPTAYVADLTTDLEAELHFGFVGVPALAVGLRSGLLFRLEHAGSATLWSIGVGGATSVRGVFEDLSLRYYF
jgi:hypothetical protein